MKLTKEDFEKLDYISSGTFGSVWHNKEIAFKKYHKTIKAHGVSGYEVIKNPCLKENQIKFHLMKHYNNKLKYTDLIIDKLYIDNQFAGVCYPYYEGDILESIIFKPIFEKVEISKQLIRNAKELTNHNIYPLDYKLNNIIYTLHGKIQIIDLDDKLTKIKLIKNSHSFNQSLVSLSKTIIHFLQPNTILYDRDVLHSLTYFRTIEQLEQKKIIKYHDLYQYINTLSNHINFILVPYDEINQHSINTIKNLIKQQDIKIILTIPENTLSSHEILNIISSISHHGIETYDVITINNSILKPHLFQYNATSYLELNHQKILYKKQ